MTHTPQIKPEWLEIIECCSAKVQIDLIRAIVAWQTDGTIPEFRGAKKAIFLIMVRDLDPTAAALIAAATAKPAKPSKPTVSQQDSVARQEEPQPDAQSAPPQAEPETTPETPPTPEPATDPFPRRKNSQRYFFGNRPLY